jgi:hypothetical protein
MKKYLLLFCLMALVQVAFAGNPTSDFTQLSEKTIAKDSVVVEFGKSGRVVIIVDSKEDFDKLKLMNINQIISELDLIENKETGELTIVELRKRDGSVKEIVKVREDGNETEVRVGGMRVYVDESGENTKVKIETDGGKSKKEKSFRTYSTVDIGINNLIENGGFPTSDMPYAVKGWGSWNFGLNWMASQKISNGFYWDFGLGFQWYNFKFENRDIQAVQGNEGIAFLERNDVDGMKSKISASYLTAMTLFKLDFGKMDGEGKRGLQVAAGPYVGYRLGGRSKFVYEDLGGSGRRKDTENTGLYLQNLRYGIRGEVGVGRVKFYTTYDLNELFQEGKGPAVTPISFGIIF